MDQEDGQSILPDGYIWSFWQAAGQEIGLYSLNMILLKAGLEKMVVAEKSLPRRIPVSVFELGLFQRSLRQYYGRGARGLLTRIGRETWRKMSRDLPYSRRLMVRFFRFMPPWLGTRLALNNLVFLLRYPGSWVVVNAPGSDLYYMDFSGLGCLEQEAGEPVCWTTVGLIHGVLESITRQEYEVEELACRAAGSETCKFRIRPI